MPKRKDINQPYLATRKGLTEDLQRLGIRPNETVMLHASVKAVGWVVGGPDVVLQSILDVIGPDGTLMMLSSWEDRPYHILKWSKEKQETYRAQCPPFDHKTSRANRNYSILAEYLRTRPGAFRSFHPENSFSAVGARAKWITDNQPLQYGMGQGSPLAKLCEVDGKVLLLGELFDSVTLTHYAEYIAKVDNKRIVHYKMPVLRDGKSVWVDIEEFDTSLGIKDWQGTDYLPVIVREYVATGHVLMGEVGAAQAYLFNAQDYVEFAVQWMEAQFAELA
jgi:aminoglycoside 3-N-acetyltransferase